MYVSIATMKVKSGKHAEARKLAREMVAYINDTLKPEYPMHILTPRFGKTNETIVLMQNFEDLSALDNFQRKMWADETYKARRSEWFELVDVNSLSNDVYTLVV